MKKTLLLLCIILLSACTNKTDEEKEVTAPMEKTNQVLLKASAEESIDQAILKLTIHNDTDRKKIFTFQTGQTYELTVLDSEGKEMYKYSKGKMFTQAIRELALQPGEKKVYQEVWGYDQQGQKASPGEYKVIAVFLGKEKGGEPLTAEGTLEIPES
ncbi:hypothetical protein J9317_06225 [Metabacillus sp. KIGAM252]|uniref:Intracellular proteinase inhibitor BsuPI domain-containing protein n=1 Tax=Metabacillus flavus TaxID=2823519 RepID=A0ABS5LCL9_9BACI|nr:BsuPI-related putative proteinase inhibitor [Metabacillus flavus]MBS2968354.1 hypothetical protein [Metabacillus flavus]